MERRKENANVKSASFVLDATEGKRALAAESCVGKIYGPSIGGRNDPE
jgi:hypothetical protein